MITKARYEDRPRFYDPELFPFLKPLVENWKDILEEYENVAKSRTHPWPETNLFQTYNDDKEASVSEGAGWNVFGLYAFNKKKQENCELCPKTAAIIESFPHEVTTAAFSILVPGAHILPHSGYIGYSDRVLRCHLGLKIPQEAEVEQGFHPQSWKEGDEREKVFLRAGDQKWGWRNGQLLVFDDTHVHEAWNLTREERVILLLDFTRPEEFLTPPDVLDKIEKEASVDPFKVGNRGALYLDSLTSNHGWSEK